MRIGLSGPVDLVIVATGLLHAADIKPEKSWRELEAGTLAQYFAVNASGRRLWPSTSCRCSGAASDRTFAALSARVGSIGDNRLGGWYGYRASKAALNMLVKTLAIELARTRPEAICMALHPGTVETDLSRPFQQSVARGKLFTPEVAAAHLLTVLERLAQRTAAAASHGTGDASNLEAVAPD